MVQIQLSEDTQQSKYFVKDDLLFLGTILRELEVLTSTELVQLLLAVRKMSTTVSVVNKELPLIFPCMVMKRKCFTDFLFLSNDTMLLCGESAKQKMINFWDGEIDKIADEVVINAIMQNIPDISSVEVEQILLSESANIAAEHEVSPAESRINKQTCRMKHSQQ